MQNLEQINQNIIPYVPIAPRVQATNPKSQLLCEKLFELIDRCVQAQLSFNHDTAKGRLSISPDQINDLLNEMVKTEQSNQVIDIEVLKASLPDLIYPMFKGEHTVSSPIWNNTVSPGRPKIWSITTASSATAPTGPIGAMARC